MQSLSGPIPRLLLFFANKQIAKPNKPMAILPCYLICDVIMIAQD
jgi:hypothetical protein